MGDRDASLPCWRKPPGSPMKVQNPSQRGPRSLQNQFWRPPARPMGEEDVSEGLGDASRLGLRRPLGGPNLVQTSHGSTSTRQLNSNTLLERFWGVSETVFEAFFEAGQDKATNRKKKILKLKSCKNICVFTIGLHIDVDVKALRNLDRRIDLRLRSSV